MAIYDGSDKRLARLFSQEYKTTEQLVGKWINNEDLYQKSYEAPIQTATSTAVILADLSGLNFDYAEIVRANLVTASKCIPIFSNLEINGTNVEYTAELGTGTAYFTVQYTKANS